jgi:hypothetical protein
MKYASLVVVIVALAAPSACGFSVSSSAVTTRRPTLSFRMSNNSDNAEVNALLAAAAKARADADRLSEVRYVYVCLSSMMTQVLDAGWMIIVDDSV